MSSAASLFYGLLILTVLWQGASSGDTLLLEIFQEMTYVGCEETPPDRPGSYPPRHQHGFEKQPLPTRLEIGKEYLFHNNSYLDDAKFALEILPGKLKSAGARIIRRPRTEDQIWWGFAGGASFSIRFVLEGKVMTIGSMGPHRRIEDDSEYGFWMQQDYYIAVWKEAPDSSR